MSDSVQKPAPKWGKVGQTPGAKTGQEKARTNRLQKTLPVGIALGFRNDGRPKPYLLRYGNPRRDEFFALEIDRNDAAEKLAAVTKTHGTQILEFDPDEWGQYLAFKKRVNAPLAEIERVFLRFKGGEALTTEDAVTRFRALRVADELDPDSVRHAKTILERFVEHCGHLPLLNVQPDHVRAWLAELKRKYNFESVTLRHHRKEVNTFFTRAVKERWALENPCAAVTPPKLRDKPVEFLSLKDAFLFFKANRAEAIVARLASEAFAGLRVSSAGRLRKADLDFQEKGIVIGRLKTTGKRDYVDGFPENLWAWLEFAQGEDWEISESYYDKLKGDAFTRALVENTGNVLRHSFGTHHLAAFRDAGVTQGLMTHRNAATFFRHYKGLGVPQREAAAYFQITPQTVLLSLDEFLAQFTPALPCSNPKSATASPAGPPENQS